MTNDSSTLWTLFKDFTIPMPWTVIYPIENFLACFGNSLSILVFWRRRRSLRRTSYLLINLAVADLSSGVFSACSTVLTAVGALNQEITYVSYFISGLSTIASISSLTLVSLETAYAVVFPFRHRTTGRRAYCFAVTLVWSLAALVSLLNSLLIAYVNDIMFPVVCSSIVIIGVCLILLSTSYLLIWWFVTKRPNRQMRETDQRKKLSLTLFVVTTLSLMTWIPGQLAFLTFYVKNFKNAGPTLQAVLLLNFLLNPLVYTFRMPEFRREIKLIICELPCCKLKLRAAAPSSPACHVISMSNIHSAHEIQVLRSPCAQFQERNDNNAKLQIQAENFNPGFINERSPQESACTANE